MASIVQVSYVQYHLRYRHTPFRSCPDVHVTNDEKSLQFLEQEMRRLPLQQLFGFFQKYSRAMLQLRAIRRWLVYRGVSGTLGAMVPEDETMTYEYVIAATAFPSAGLRTPFSCIEWSRSRSRWGKSGRQCSSKRSMHQDITTGDTSSGRRGLKSVIFVSVIAGWYDRGGWMGVCLLRQCHHGPGDLYANRTKAKGLCSLSIS
jgi:hypothetical protein